ncbi:mutS protein homolog 4 [Plutella xylostella]|uniref:mutS protein homolog 4 n=1 Tax=Plutella xylostella TaxID=51655 RepID=UPI002032F555|nr:mutS protein homolog 4 [Plutella xylostella]
MRKPPDEPARELFIELGVLTVPSLFILEVANSSRPYITHTHSSRITQTSTSSAKPSSMNEHAARVLASDSAAESGRDFTTPRNRPSAFRYISSSSRGGYSGTRSARSTGTSVAEPSVILAISEGRGQARGEIGLAAVDLRRPHLVLCQFSDTRLYLHTLTKIHYFNPVEIIVPHTFCSAGASQLCRVLREQLPARRVTAVQRRHFNDAAGRQQIQTLCAPQYSAVYLQVLHKFYAVTAAAAVLKYVEYIQCVVFARESLKIEYHSSENTMIIDTVVVRSVLLPCKSIETSQFLVQPYNHIYSILADVGSSIELEVCSSLSPSAGATSCLLGVLGPTYTVAGVRALRASLLQPSCNKDEVEARLDAVQDLMENDDGLMAGIQDVIKKLSDVDKILLLCMDSASESLEAVGEAQLNQVLLLKTTMELVPSLASALGSAVSGKLRTMRLEFENPNYQDIADRIRTIIQDDAHLEKGAMGSLQRCFAVKPEINGLLDVARRTYSELIEDIQKIVEQLSETYDLPIRLNQNVLKGFHIVLPLAPRNRRNFRVEDLPDIFIQVSNSGASVSMSTEELVVLDQQAKEALNEIQKMSNIVISGLIKDLRPHMSSLYKLCENVAELDILIALAHASIAGSYIRPEFSNYMDVRNSVHPLLDYNSQTMPVPNDIVRFLKLSPTYLKLSACQVINFLNYPILTAFQYASPEQNFTIITGPNMGGKSIYIKQIAVIQIMAQIGCFIPATKGVVRLCDRIFSRIGFNDSVELNASTYVLEMKEIQHILKGLTKNSLVIIDELCRGTCTEEGTSMAWAICEELLASDAFTFFTTHFMYLTRLQDLYFNVVNLHTSVTEENVTDTQNTQTAATLGQKRLVYKHKIEPGTTAIECYGLALASKTNLPEETVKLAEELAALIIQRKKPQEIKAPEKKVDKLLYELNVEICKETRKHENPEPVTKQLLQKFKQDHPEVIEKLKMDRNSISDTSGKSSNPNRRGMESSNQIVSSRDTFVENTMNRRKPQSILYSNSDFENDVSNPIVAKKTTPLVYSTTDVDDMDKIPNINAKPIHAIAQKPPRVVYSTTDETDNHSTNENPNYTSVRSSNELLNTIIRDIDNFDNVETPQKNSQLGNKSAVAEDIINTTQMTQNLSSLSSQRVNSPNRNHEINTESYAQMSQNISRLSSHSLPSVNNVMRNEFNRNLECEAPEMDSLTYLEQSNARQTAMEEEINNISHAIETHSMEVDDLDIAEALTQVLETDETLISQFSAVGTSSSSVDEELMRETIKEINDELVNVSFLENVILTPPMEFRD